MSEGTPSMTALLGLLALAGYQNRDKIAEWLGGGHGDAPPAGQPAAPQRSQPQGGSGGGLGGLLSNLGVGAGSAGAGGFLNSGLGEMLQRFQQGGQGAVAQSWVDHGQNQPIGPQALEQAIGPDVLAALTQRTGLSREDLLSRLSRELPQAVDRYTPDGRLPA